MRKYYYDILLPFDHNGKVIPHLKPAKRLVDQHILNITRRDEPISRRL